MSDGPLPPASPAALGSAGRLAGAGGPIILIGPPGSGKTRVGAALARRLRLPFTDTDREVEQRTGLTVADIFLTHGEAQFRAWERQAARDAIVGRGPAVVALGGGAPLDNATAQLMAGHFTVYLQVSAAQAIRRVGLSETRPLLASSPRARWRELMAQREPVYRRLATVVIATDVGRPAALAAQIAKLWAQGAINEGAKL